MAKKRITPVMLTQAEESLRANLARRKKKGETVKVSKKPYHEGLSHIRCVLTIDGEQTRLLYQPKNGLWRKV